jgi:hypothetical protein
MLNVFDGTAIQSASKARTETQIETDRQKDADTKKQNKENATQ